MSLIRSSNPLALPTCCRYLKMIAVCGITGNTDARTYDWLRSAEGHLEECADPKKIAWIAS